MLDVLHVCVIAELGAILYAPRYVGDVVNYSDKHRKSFIRCRDLAHEIVLHLDASYQIKSSSGRLNQVAVFYFKFLVKQVQAFWLQQSKTRPSSGTGPKQLDAIAEAIARLFHGNEQFWKEWAKCSQPEQRSSLRYGLLGKGYTLTPTFSKIRSGRSQARGQFPISTMMRCCSFTRSQNNFIRTRWRLPKTRTRTRNWTQKYETAWQR